jgi:Tol biopolymer transport system component
MSRVVVAAVAGLVCVASVVAVTPPVAVAGSSPALLGYDDGSNGVYETPIGASGTATLVAPAGVYPQFSPNGVDIAYDVERSKANGKDLTNSIVVAGRTGGAPHDVITGPATFDGAKDSVLYPLVWSPDGKEIAYGCDGHSDAPSYAPSELLYEWEQVCVVNVTTGAHHMVTDPATDKEPPIGVGLDTRWSWTPNGNDILATVDEPGPCLPGFSFATGCGTASIGRITVDTGATTLLTKSSLTTSTQFSPTVSPDGKQILFSRQTGTTGSGLYIMNAGGGDQKAVDTAGLYGSGGAIFTPDGKDVVFAALPSPQSHYPAAFEMALSGEGKLKQLTTGDNHSVYDMTWSPAVTSCTVPNLKHKTLGQAKKLLTKAACSLGKISGPKSHRSTRHIISQSIKANRDEPAGTKVNVKIK